MSQKKAEQLGMNPSTAQNRLNKEILFALVVQTGQDICFHCGEKISRESLSIEHKTPWLDSEDPVGLFFDLSNIAFSHLGCNASAGRIGKGHGLTDEEKRERVRRWSKEARDRLPPEVRKQRRRDRYLRTGR